MAQQRGNRTRASNLPAIERASGRSWTDWVRLFETESGSEPDHKELVRIALAALPDTLENPEWWAQGTAIAYEQHAGLRVPGQSSAGDFRVSASRTLANDRDTVVDTWVAKFGEQPHRGFIVVSARRSRTEKRTFWRASLEGAGKLEVAAEAKADGRTLVAVNHTALSDSNDIELWRAHWKTCLGEL